MTNLYDEKDAQYLYVPTKEDALRGELAVLDRFLAFSAELVRLALLGIAVFAFLIEKTFADSEVPTIVKTLGMAGVILFGLSAAAALAYRYGATDALRLFVRGLRLQALPGSNEEARLTLKVRDEWLAWCIRLKIAAVAFLALGAVAISVAFALAI